jgi:hypothetical protein
VRASEVTVAGPGRVRVTGAATEAPEVEVVTDYVLEAGARWVRAESTFTNRGTAPRTLWVGDVIDYDGPGQRSGVAGIGTITVRQDYAPAGRWIAQTGSDQQLYALVYDAAGWTAYGESIWIMSQRQVTIEPGQAFALTRRIVATAAGTGDSPWAPLDAL